MNDTKRHLVVNVSATPDNYTLPPKKMSPAAPNSSPVTDRQAHAGKLINRLKTLDSTATEIVKQQKESGLDINGNYVSFESAPDFLLQLKSLESKAKGIELCSSKITSNNVNEATVFIPEGQLAYFIETITKYRDEDGKPRKDGSTAPKNQPLVESIDDIKLAVLQSLWTDEDSLCPQTDTEAIWWEVWIRLADDTGRIGYFREHATAMGLEVKERDIRFVDRAVLLAYGTRADMIGSMNLLGVIGELRKAKEVAGFFTELPNREQAAWINDALPNILVSSATNTYACVLDSGINEGHPLLEPVVSSADVHTCNPDWGKHDGARDGHGTPMAGLVAYGDLTHVLPENHPVTLNYRIESVKILPNDGMTPNQPDVYGAITEDGISQVEGNGLPRNRVYCMAVSTDDRDKGKPSSWSAKIDQLAIGEDDDPARLIILSAGNMPATTENLTAYPESNRIHNVQDPGQAWNAVTVGAYTEKVNIDTPERSAYEPVAFSGDLSPISTTSMNWNSEWPLKPEIVMEGGNWGVDRSSDGFPDFFSEIDDLQLLSTHHEFNERSLTGFMDTSAATALATRLAAQLRHEYPEFWPETVRGLLVHSAEWTEAQKSYFDLRYKGESGYADLLRYCGYGVPNQQKMLWSASNHLTLIAQDTIKPFFKDGSTIKTKHVNLHELPWPADVLADLGGENVQMKVTLSYFIEPNPGQRGWKTKYSYASHRLKFDVRRAGESVEEFQKRINKKARETGYQNPGITETGTWKLGSNLRSHGSVHSDTWSGTAADLAERKYIAIYPMNGWWKELKKHQGWDNYARYSLIVSIETPETDIYTSVQNQIETIVEIPVFVD